jgi:hypothetical protein
MPIIRVRLRYTGIRFFCTRLKTLSDIPEIHPVQEQVDDEQCGECKAPVIVHVQPLVPGKPKIGSPVPASPTTGWQEEEQYQPGNKRGDEGYQASDIDKSIDGDSSHENPHDFLELSGLLNPMDCTHAGHEAFFLT